MKKRHSSKTSNFGVSTRTGHDSSSFYAGNLYVDYQGIESDEDEGAKIVNSFPSTAANKIFCKTSEIMSEIPDNSVHLMVTSPPYNVGKEYDQNLLMTEYRDFLRAVWRETWRVLVPGGRACINIANIGRKPYIPLHTMINTDMLDLGFLMRGEIIWNKGASSGSSCAWGSWKSPSNPVLRDVHEYILVFCKGGFARDKRANHESDLTREEFLEYTKSIWSFNTESARRVNHPAPFPLELPRRCIKLYTYINDVVLDPFMGCGTTAVAALETGRQFVGYEVDENYVNLTNARIDEYHQSQKQLSLHPL